jgi:hypothetical protein
MFNRAASILLVAFIAATDAEKVFCVPAARPHPITNVAKSKSSLLKIRGGAGPIDKDAAAKIAMAITAIQGAYGMLAPSKVVEQWGSSSNPLLDAMTEGMSTVTLRSALMGYLAIKGEPLNKVVGIGIIPGLITIAKVILNETPAKVGTSMKAEVLFAAMDAAVAYACLSNATYADTAIKLYIGWGLINGLGDFFAPKKLLEAWGVADADDLVTWSTKGYGANILAITVFGAALVNGADPLKAYGYSWSPIVLSLFSYLFITKEVEKFGMNVFPYYFYLVLGAVMVGTLAF